MNTLNARVRIYELLLRSQKGECGQKPSQNDPFKDDKICYEEGERPVDVSYHTKLRVQSDRSGHL